MNIILRGQHYINMYSRSENLVRILYNCEGVGYDISEEELQEFPCEEHIINDLYNFALNFVTGTDYRIMEVSVSFEEYKLFDRIRDIIFRLKRCNFPWEHYADVGVNKISNEDHEWEEEISEMDLILSLRT